MDQRHGFSAICFSRTIWNGISAKLHRRGSRVSNGHDGAKGRFSDPFGSAASNGPSIASRLSLASKLSLPSNVREKKLTELVERRSRHTRASTSFSAPPRAASFPLPILNQQKASLGRPSKRTPERKQVRARAPLSRGHTHAFLVRRTLSLAKCIGAGLSRERHMTDPDFFVCKSVEGIFCISRGRRPPQKIAVTWLLYELRLPDRRESRMPADTSKVASRSRRARKWKLSRRQWLSGAVTFPARPRDACLRTLVGWVSSRALTRDNWFPRSRRPAWVLGLSHCSVGIQT